MTTIYKGASVFDGYRIRPGSLLVKNACFAGTFPPGDPIAGAKVVDLDGGILAPGFVDLQVNGGGGVMLNDDPSFATIERIATAHARLGTLTLLPTLITDGPEKTRAAVEAAVDAVAKGVPGIAGLHLEGPHIALMRKGAHDPALIREMTTADLEFIVAAAKRLPNLMVTLAPETVDNAKIAALARAGVIVSLGHSDAGYDLCCSAFAAGASLGTHLFNAMSPLGSREPGLAGAILATGRCHAGLIADGIHVHPRVIAAAVAAKSGPGEIFLVTDAMAPAGTDMKKFTLNGRTIHRSDGKLMLENGTLAGADLDMARALRVMTADVGLPLTRALAMATRIPSRVLAPGCSSGQIRQKSRADFIHLADDLTLRSVWRGGEIV